MTIQYTEERKWDLQGDIVSDRHISVLYNTDNNGKINSTHGCSPQKCLYVSCHSDAEMCFTEYGEGGEAPSPPVPIWPSSLHSKHHSQPPKDTSSYCKCINAVGFWCVFLTWIRMWRGTNMCPCACFASTCFCQLTYFQLSLNLCFAFVSEVHLWTMVAPHDFIELLSQIGMLRNTRRANLGL